ncbi:MAG: CCA tRNA nucleotidyltransferase, partial [Mesorhizobium sp.]
PVFPIKGADLAELGAAPGPRLGAILKSLEKEWIGSGFTLDRGALIERAVKALEA